MEVKATLEEKISKKSGNPYFALVVHLTDTCTKTIFLEPAEIELLKMAKNNNQTEEVKEYNWQ